MFRFGIAKSAIPAKSDDHPGTGRVEILRRAGAGDDESKTHVPSGQFVEVENHTAAEIAEGAVVKVSGAEGTPGRRVEAIEAGIVH